MMLCDPVHKGSTATKLLRRWKRPCSASLVLLTRLNSSLSTYNHLCKGLGAQGKPRLCRAVVAFPKVLACLSSPPSACLSMQRLSDLYYDIHRSYLKVAEVVNSEKRLFGRYYRVAFYGQVSELGFFCLHSHRFQTCSWYSSGKHLVVITKNTSWVRLPAGFWSGESTQLPLCKPLLWI